MKLTGMLERFAHFETPLNSAVVSLGRLVAFRTLSSRLQPHSASNFWVDPSSTSNYFEIHNEGTGFSLRRLGMCVGQLHVHGIGVSVGNSQVHAIGLSVGHLQVHGIRVT